MTDVVLTKQRIEPGKTDHLREWTQEIQDREDEALETLEQEGMHHEAAFVEHTDDGDFLVYFMQADDMDRVFDAFAESDHPIDAEHKEVMREVLVDGENVGDYELLYQLSNPNRPE
ncbi:DUF6176 family protein [Haloarchaeobius sp. DFWS5]|uniref:DUF6176 family protein n=1 Tax=Haloarchaeobius sp. DFWS5 TaxID=3446114 RepID=UPI003EBA933A